MPTIIKGSDISIRIDIINIKIEELEYLNIEYYDMYGERYNCSYSKSELNGMTVIDGKLFAIIPSIQTEKMNGKILSTVSFGVRDDMFPDTIKDQIIQSNTGIVIKDKR